jgi:hypothetical protein
VLFLCFLQVKLTYLQEQDKRLSSKNQEAWEMERPIHCSRTIGLLAIIILWKKSTLYYVSKNYLHHYIGHVEKSLSPMLCSWTLTSCKLIDKLRKILSQKPLTLHAWKYWCKKTIICWKHCFLGFFFLCLACSMTHKRVIALETLKFLHENSKLVNYLS